MIARKATSADEEIAAGAIPRSPRRARKHFDEVADRIIDCWVRRRASALSGESATSWFKRNMYRLIKAYIDADHGELFADIAKRSGRSLVGLEKIRSNPFKVAMFAMWSDNESMTRHQQRVFGNQMFYAHLHNVEPEHLIGFIRVAGSAKKIAEKLEAGTREPGFCI